MIEIRQVTAREGGEYVRGLAEVLLDCVAGGASVGFMASLSKTDAERFFENVLNEVERKNRILLAAFIDSELVGTVQILTATPPNQPHRADLAKLLVRRSARGRGIGSLLLKQAEDESRLSGKTLLVLDTVTGDYGERLYLHLGWMKVGVIPRYAVYPDGRWCDTTILYKNLGT